MSSVELVTAFPAAAEVGRKLRQKGLTLAVAESCTGGLLGAALTAVPGSSAYLLGGVIAYSNEIKVRLLGVEQALLDRVGAVSEEVATAMSEGVRRLFNADIGIGITGVAGPGAESAAKPAGLVYVAVSSANKNVGRRIEGDKGREGNRVAAVVAALELCLEEVAGKPST